MTYVTAETLLTFKKKILDPRKKPEQIKIFYIYRDYPRMEMYKE